MDKLYEFHTTTRESFTGIYRAYSEEEKERVIQDMQKKGLSFLIKEYTLTSETVYNKIDK